MKSHNLVIAAALLSLLSMSLVSALIVSDIEMGKLHPGDSTTLKIEVKNTLSDDIEDISFSLDLEDTEFTTIGGSEKSEEEIKKNDKEVFDFTIKASPSLKPGDYHIPYKVRKKKKQAVLGLQ